MFGLTCGNTEQKMATLEELARAGNALDGSTGIPCSFWAEEGGERRDLSAEEAEELANLQTYYADLDACDPAVA